VRFSRACRSTIYREQTGLNDGLTGLFDAKGAGNEPKRGYWTLNGWETMRKTFTVYFQSWSGLSSL
jgi:hypothetical protein